MGGSEINLRPYQLCNLTSVTVRGEDTEETLARKIRLASILGTFQSTLTNFKYVRKIWQKNTEEERLLGVSLNGVMGNTLLNDHKDKTLPARLERLRDVAIETNFEFADIIGIPRSTATCCIKPEGTTSQLVNSSSGMHAWHAPYYIRRVRGDKKDPLTAFMMSMGVPVKDDVYGNGHSTAVFEFPMKAPKGSVFRNDRSAIEQMELWLLYQRHWCEHKPSITVYYKDDEFMALGAWLWENFDEISGVSFLPHSDHTYALAPYEDCTEEEYERLMETMPKEIDWTKLTEFEREDTTTGTQELACSAGGCEIV